ncbi:hypothetical protein HZC09_00830, partial [Candidatus Micrarchaeota archaeon]|nr:hypothetical protein [Candidatus Micrarchaeota archaeon]
NTTGTISILTSQGYLITQGTASQGQTVSTTNVEATVTNTTNVNATNNTVIIRVASLTSQPQPSTYFTDAFGEAKAEINPGTYNVQYYKSGYNATNSTAIISRATTTTKSICLEPVTCDFSVEMLSAPTCGYQNDYYQVRIVNKVNETKNVSLTYSTSEIDGPMSVVLAPKESTIVNMKARSANPIISGQSLGIVNFRGGNACMQSYTLPLCTAQEITLSAPQNKISTPPGKTSCASVIARNRAKENAVVTMTSASTTTSLKTTISPDTFQLTPLETKNLDVCITPPAGFSGTATVTLKASSAFGESNATLQVDSMGQGFYYADFNSCPIIDASKTTSYTITLRNSGEDGDYTLALEDNPLAVKREYALPQFQKDTARAIVLQLEPQDVKAGEVRFNAYLKKEGFTVFQQGLCFDIRGTTVVSAELAENSIDVRKGQTRATFITVRNFGSLKSKYTVQVGSTPLNVKATPMTFILNPREEQVVEVTVGSSEAMTTQTYSVPIQIYADATVSTTAQNHEVTLQCGNGQTSAISCPAGRGTCTATCTYGTEGFFTPSATIAGISCSTASATVRSLSTLQNKCTLYASPNSVERGATLTVTANYNQLPSTLNGSIQINCGNGQSSTANNCNGQTGACTATCTYANEGNYIVSATAANTACEDARVAVTNPSAQTCSIASSPNNIVKGESTSVVLRYSGLPVTGTTTQTQYYQVLSDTENLLVNVVSKSAAISLSTAELTVAGIAPQQVLLGATAQIPVTVKNENYFTIDNVLVYASNLPSGVIATPPTKFGLGPGEQKTVYVRIEATPSAELGTTQIKIHSESALTQATANSVFLSVLLSGENQINAGIKLTVTPTEDGKAFAVSAKITNKEPEAFTVTASMALPEGWSYSMQPQSTSVLPSGEEEIQGIITPFAYDPAREYDATMVLQTKDGRIMKLPFKVTREGGSILAGLVTSEETAALIGIAIALFLVAAAAFFLAARHQHKRR